MLTTISLEGLNGTKKSSKQSQHCFETDGLGVLLFNSEAAHI